jgi:hypothetical protein
MFGTGNHIATIARDSKIRAVVDGDSGQFIVFHDLGLNTIVTTLWGGLPANAAECAVTLPFEGKWPVNPPSPILLFADVADRLNLASFSYVPLYPICHNRDWP